MEKGVDAAEKTKYPRLLFSAPASGSGKTMITCGFLEILRKREISCISCKCGPDYIDPLFHRYVLGIWGYNLDSFFLPPEQVRALFFEKAQKGKMAVIEGAMGYYDGVAGISTHASAYEIAQITDTPSVLIVDGKKSSLSLVALVKGFLEYQKDSRISGVILNRTSASMAGRLKPFFEQLGLRFFGAVPECKEAMLESRHLGLTLPGEQIKLREKIEALACRLESCLDVEGLLDLAGNVPEAENMCPMDEGFFKGRKKSREKKKGRIAIASDEAFCFYYQENCEFLEQEGWELVPFSPIHDRTLPQGVSALLLGGGYPEVYARQLSENRSMLEEIRAAEEYGIKILAECGGFLYLHQTLEGEDGNIYPMAGVIRAHGYRAGKLSRFGYVVLYDKSGRAIIRGHEFHYWDSTMPGSDWRAVKPLSSIGWDCMVVTDKLLAGFPHLYYLSRPGWVRSFLENRPYHG